MSSPSACSMTYLSHHDLAVYLNDAGCSLIEAGGGRNLDAATSTLRDALDALSRPPVAVHGNHHHATAKDIEECLSYRAELLGRAQDFLNVTPDEQQGRARRCSSKEQQQREQRRADPLVYSEPLRLETLDEDITSHHQDSPSRATIDELSLEEISSVVLFNVSLAYHLIGERLGSAAHIDRAVRFYEMTETMVLGAIEGQRNSSSSPSPDSAHRFSTIVKAVLNNMGQICLHWLGETRLAREYFARLASITTTGPAQGSSSAAGTPRPPLIDIFAFNAMVAGGMSAAGAA